MHALETVDVDFRYPNGTHALQGVNIKIKTGSKIAILGPNGAGKSTLLYLFNATFKPTSGTVFLNGDSMHYDSSSLRSIRQKVGIVFQNSDEQLFAPTVKQDVSFGPLNLRLSVEEVEKRVSKSLNMVGISGFENLPPHNLSTGEKKKVAIAGVLAMEPEIMIFDEPLSGLDPRGQAELTELLDQLNADEKTIIVTTHRMDFAAEWADEIWILKNGQVIKKGEPNEIFSDMSLIHGANLQVPMPIQTHNELYLRGFANKQVPLSVLELVESVIEFSGEDEYNNYYALAKDDFAPHDECFIGFENGALVAFPEDFKNCFARFRCTEQVREGKQIPIDLSNIPEGKVWIVRTPSSLEGGAEIMLVTVVRGLIDSKKPHRIGAMGTVAKSIVKNTGLNYDFGGEVVNSAVSASRRGLSTMIFATGKMADLAAKRIAYLNQRMGEEICFQMVDEEL
ncbi:MAG: ATP-binding cassette domain-containing protein [Methanosarcinaceae archaeon]|nr:ATP-binding cassette domain-containing protein [Methanosarcinaceae archaeon]